MTDRRTDIHRPSWPEFNPQDYDLLGVFDLAAALLAAKTCQCGTLIAADGTCSPECPDGIAAAAGELPDWANINTEGK